MKTTALIAEDEPLLAHALRAELATAWPELEVLATVADGHSAVRDALRLLPQVLFFDIRMPGQDGLAAAAELADAWPVDEAQMPQLVFVTAYDEYAARAFDAQAIDYVLKPVQPERLRRTVARLRQALEPSQRNGSAPSPEDALAGTLSQWRQLLAAAGGAAALPGVAGTAPLKLIAASEAGTAGSTVRMVPVEEVQYFEAADKYVRVLTASREYLIRTPLKQLLPQLDAGVFWQVHRAIVVRSDAIDSVHRDEAGKLHLALRGRTEKIPVSRLYAHLFKAM
ncbi:MULTISPECIES: LytTR family DNA-binding domain-containing protein [unclassified Variovorax]|uniref:LytR/AlgR family response regulator transcription factor n=1 Tax=unclassified Variovorax TaxID=663243 RepID=UPI00076D671F|nr:MULTISPECIES: LytTR family DNA-binding domain-containing protein [unclassified Variovorax]KWT72444.1 Transcriptional regulator protein [Variovorax sp. WDL1]PNG47516.1 Transcriptional regulatory protein YehT [Variovorax sp. B2]PNG47833.1 Transcriptional regulatory protein YehT [Variovorax sp. B4]VTV15433.1 Transcriptional regulatory protein YehT [Variovorax sp. WDL1]